jgi:hypothetical protein
MLSVKDRVRKQEARDYAATWVDVDSYDLI